MAEYRRKRSFSATAEPQGRKRRGQRRPRFVIQKHAARTLHYDFRLEAGGVLKSWAVPKGPSTNPKDKRLAVPTEDHPLEYADFEGVIPEGQYGAGSVIVWDRGTYRNLGDAPVEEQLDRGHVSVRLYGKKLRGGYILQRTRLGRQPQWLLIKAADDEADARRKPVSTEPRSVLSGRTVEEVAAEAETELDGVRTAKGKTAAGKRAPGKTAKRKTRAHKKRSSAESRSRRFDVSNADKVLFPDVGVTKGDLIEYYERIADVMLPHVRGRIVTMRRYPDGIEGKSFYQKDVPDYFPEWIETVEVRKQGGTLRQLIVEDAATLAYLANQACIAIHVWPSRADKPNHPDRLILDLDPSGDDFGPVRKAACSVRAVLEELGLAAYVMTTGSTGLHVVSPLDRKSGFDATRELASLIARVVAARDPERFTVEQRKSKRRGRVFIDYMRNAYAQHGIAPYSVRARPLAPVAAPLDWHELGDGKLHSQRVTIGNVFRRLSRKDDPWKDLSRHASSVDNARRRLDRILRDEPLS